MTQVVVSASVCLPSTDQEQITRAAEAFSRISAGLALEGISVSVSFGVVED